MELGGNNAGQLSDGCVSFKEAMSIFYRKQPTHIEKCTKLSKLRHRTINIKNKGV